MTNLREYFNYVEPMTEEQLKMYQTKMTAVSLFAGVGGFDLALERNGVKVVSSVEIDKHASGVLSKHFPNSAIHGDVQKVTGDDLRHAGFIPDRGILTGGFPCQDLSVAGKRAGLAGARSGLYWEIIRLIEETGPEWVVLENVPGLLSSNNGRDFGVVIGALVGWGYGVAWRVLDAQYFGVPQRRRRVFIVARRAGDAASCAKVLFERQSVRGNLASSGATEQEITGNTGEGPEGYGQTSFAGYTKGSTTLTATTYKRPEDNLVVSDTYPVRRLTPLECERLQGFPDGWTEGQADSHRYKQMGNAVAVPVVEWVIAGIVEVMANE